MVQFGGLPREEVEKLHWSALDFKTGHINVPAQVSKVARERFGPMSDNLRAWLLPSRSQERPYRLRILMHEIAGNA